MATTAQEIINQAMGTSNRNRPETIGTAATEYLRVLNNSLKGLFSDGLERNRWYFSFRTSVPWDGTQLGWLRPAGIESVVRIEQEDGTEVVSVPPDQRFAEAKGGRPSVYQVGRIFYPAGNPQDPEAGDALVFFCSRVPASLSGVTSTLDTAWPEQFNEILVYDLAIYLALKDGNRENEVAAFGEIRKAAFRRFINFLSHENLTMVQMYGHGGYVATSGVSHE